jgi:hypothetical protein
MASEYYSIAKTLPRASIRDQVLEVSYRHVEAAFAGGATSGKHALRGSIRFARRDRIGGLLDYEATVRLREGEEAATDAELGDARSELGFALVFDGQRERGLAEMEAGVALLERAGPSGFLVRAKRKLGRAYLRAFSPARALSTLEEAHDMALANGLLDQIDDIDRMAAEAARQIRLARLRLGR